MRNRAALLSLLLAAPSLSLASACSHAGTRSTFVAERPNDEAIDLLTKGLEAQGFTVAVRNARVVTTVWRDSGLVAPEPILGELEAHLFVRYRVRYQSAVLDEHRVEVVAEVKRCAAGHAVIRPDEVIGLCEPVEAPPAAQKEALAALTRELARVVSAPSPSVQAAN